MWLIRPVVRWISATSDQVRTWRIAVQNVVAGRESRAMLIFILAEAQGTQRDLQVFVGATKVAPTDYSNLCVPCASARKQDVKSPAPAGLSARRKRAATVRLSRKHHS